MKRRLLPILMTLVLVCALPIWAAFVTSGDVTNPLVCTADATSSEESAVEKLKLAISNGGTVQLTEDIEITQTLYVERSLTLDLNGHVLKMTGNSSVLRVKEGPHPVTLTITDSRPQNPHGSYAGLPAGGVITGGKGTDAGGECSLCWGSRIPGEWYNAEAGGRHAYRKQRQQCLYQDGCDLRNERRHDHRRNCRRT